MSADAPSPAVQARKDGNKALVAGNAEEAYALYTAGLAHSPDDHLLLGNRSEALLVMKRAREALDDATLCIRHSRGRWSKAFLRKANAEVALGMTRDAIKTLREGMRTLADGDARQPWLDKIASVKDIHFAVRVGDTAGMGRVLLANTPFAAGKEVLSELPILMWDSPQVVESADGPERGGDRPLTQPTPLPPAPTADALREAGADAPEDAAAKAAAEEEAAKAAAKAKAEEEQAPQLEGDEEGVYVSDKASGPQGELSRSIRRLCEATELHPGFALHLENYLHLSPEEQDVLLDCCCPSVPLSRVAVNMVRAARVLGSHPAFKEVGQMKILKLMMINKVNTHRMLTEKSGIFEVNN